VSEAKLLRTLEDENGKLKRMLADAMPDNVALKDFLGKKW
jgi:putative transposase